MSVPGFTAEASLARTRVHYHAMAAKSDAIRAADLELALYTDPSVPVPDVDCNTFPDGSTCNECGATGPGTLNCCKLAKKGPADCVVKPYTPNSVSVLSILLYANRGSVVQAPYALTSSL